MTDRKNIDFLKDIRQSADLISKYLDGLSKREFIKNVEKQDAVINRLLVIGEAAKLVSRQIRNKHSEIPWSDMAGMRDVLIHRYHGIDLEVVWKTINNDLPGIREKINQIIKNQLNSY